MLTACSASAASTGRTSAESASNLDETGAHHVVEVVAPGLQLIEPARGLYTERSDCGVPVVMFLSRSGLGCCRLTALGWGVSLRWSLRVATGNPVLL